MVAGRMPLSYDSLQSQVKEHLHGRNARFFRGKRLRGGVRGADSRRGGGDQRRYRRRLRGTSRTLGARTAPRPYRRRLRRARTAAAHRGAGRAGLPPAGDAAGAAHPRGGSANVRLVVYAPRAVRGRPARRYRWRRSAVPDADVAPRGPGFGRGRRWQRVFRAGAAGDLLSGRCRCRIALFQHYPRERRDQAGFAHNGTGPAAHR